MGILRQAATLNCGLPFIFEWYASIVSILWCWSQKVFCPLWYTDCSAFHAPAILKTFEIRPVRATFSCFTGPKVMLFHASMKRITFWPWYHHFDHLYGRDKKVSTWKNGWNSWQMGSKEENLQLEFFGGVWFWSFFWVRYRWWPAIIRRCIEAEYCRYWESWQ